MRKEAGKKIIQSSEAEALFLTSPATMRYVAGFTGEGYVYVSEKHAIVVTDSRYTIAAKQECPGFSVIEWKSKNYYKAVTDAIREDGINFLGIEDETMTVAAYQKLSKALKNVLQHECKLVPLGQAAENLRQVKSASEIQCIEEAEAIGDRAFAKLLADLGVGMTEKQVAAKLEFYMKEEGADGFSFDTIAASGIHSAMPHAVPTDKRLESGDFLTMDFGCLYHGYCSDMTRTVVIGHAEEKQRKIYDTVLKAQQAALDGIRPGMTGREVDALARDVIAADGFGAYFGHSLGHSVGLCIHEKPCFSPGEDTVIKPGMVITVEPGIYIEDFGGVRIEDVVVITEDGCRNLTHSPKELMEIKTLRNGD